MKLIIATVALLTLFEHSVAHTNGNRRLKKKKKQTKAAAAAAARKSYHVNEDYQDHYLVRKFRPIIFFVDKNAASKLSRVSHTLSFCPSKTTVRLVF